MLISKKQLDELDKIKLNDFVQELSQLLTNEFNYKIDEQENEKNRLKNFITKMIESAKIFNLDEKNSITAFVVLNHLNGENFLEKEEFKIYKYYLQSELYNPNDYIFEIPTLNT
jgi:hypothetical protein